jgi:MICOS complex subunit MIC60
LKNALSSGLPFKDEVEALHNSLDGIDKDSLIDLVLASLPEEAVNHGTDTPMQLNQKVCLCKLLQL